MSRMTVNQANDMKLNVAFKRRFIFSKLHRFDRNKLKE
jgi:hypothetical protein